MIITNMNLYLYCTDKCAIRREIGELLHKNQQPIQIDIYLFVNFLIFSRYLTSAINQQIIAIALRIDFKTTMKFAKQAINTDCCYILHQFQSYGCQL